MFFRSSKGKWEETYAYVEKNLKGFEREEPEVDPRVTTLKGEENILAFCRILIRRAQKK